MSNIAIKVNAVKKVYKLYEKPILRLKESLSITRKSFHSDHFALDSISFDVEKGQCVGIIGTNGSGKSTLLKIITGVLNPSEGNVKVEGKISALLELGTGFNMDYTGIENIYLSGMMLGYSEEEMKDKVDSIIEFAEIGEFINQPVKTYSSGMFARLAFAVAINVDPDILIVDEALSVGDIFFQAKCYRKFNEFKALGKTILFVSHDMSSVLKYCEKTLLIHNGKQIMYGRTSDAINTYKKILVNQYDEEEDAEAVTCDGETQEASAVERVLKSTEDGGWKSQMLINPNFIDYGEKKAAIVDFAIIDEYGKISNIIHKNSEFQIKMKVKFNEDVKNPIFAYTIKDIKGTDVTGTNTMLENNNIEFGKKDETITVVFTQKMLLQGAQYLISLGCTGYEGDQFVVYNRLYDICNLEVISQRNTIGFCDLEAEVSYE